MKFYTQDVETVFSEVHSGMSGLTQAEADKRLAENGKNKLVEPERDSLFKRFLAQLNDPTIILLLAAAAISGVMAVVHDESFADVIIILAIVIINAILGVYQENKAEKAIEALHKMTAATSKVFRDGKQVVIPSEDLVVGDVINLESGDAVPADGRILFSASMKIEESSLTGESVPVNKFIDILNLESGTKDVPLGDRKNMCYMGSTVVYGHGLAVVTDTGMKTEMGKIATALTEAEDETTPLQRKLAELSHFLTKLVIGICLFVFAFGVIKSGSLSVNTILNTFMVAVSLAVAAIPEGLVAVVTIVLSVGVTNMSQRNAVIRRLSAVETLGSAQVICSDKTGTLTQNKMTVVETYADDDRLLAQAMALCSDAELVTNGEPGSEKVEAQGEPTEAALVNYANKISLDKNTLKAVYPRIGEAPFDSMRKMMSTVHKTEDSDIIQYTKGAPDEVLLKCTSVLKDGKVVPLNDALREEILQANKKMAEQALRVLAGAQKEYETVPESYEANDIENGLTFLGLSGMIDPVRPEVTGAIVECREAGIRPVMITGDHKDTAVAIAKQLGIIADESEAVMGSQLNDISDEQFEQDIEKISVYARVQPEHKVRIVKTWRKKGMITAMTGDGVNDAPSIKSADIGIGMGISGTDVTKNVSDMVLADDNFATIVAAVEEGRRIYDNILKVIQYLLSSNISEVLSVFLATLMGFTIFKPVYLLWINLITDALPALALGFEEAEGDLMKRKPRDPKAGVFANGMGFNIGYQGVLATVITLAAYFIGHYMEAGKWEITQSADGMTMAFLTMSMTEIWHSFNMRSQRNSIFHLKSHNFYLFGAMLLALVMTSAVIFIPPFAAAFDFEPISLKEYAVAMALAVTIIPVVEIVKLIQRKTRKE